MRPARALPLLLLVAACGEEPLLHRLDERQANQVLVALGEAGVGARKLPEGGEEGTFAISVRPVEAEAARGVLSSRDLPRARSPGFTELFAGGGLVPTPLEEHARYLHAISGELERTLESLDGVISARVHLALPTPDPLRPGARRAPSGSVLVKCRPGGRERVDAQAEGLRRIVAGAAEGLEPSAVAVVVTEAAPPPPRPSRVAWTSRAWVAASGLTLSLCLSAVAVVLVRRRREVA